MMEAQQHIGPFILGKTLGVGSTGKVKLGIHKDTGQKVAIKIVKKEFLESKPSLRRKIEREIAVMKLIDHPHVLRLYDVFETVSHLFLVLEHVEGGELFDYLVKKGRLDPLEAHRFFRQIIGGLQYCHRQLICHRDLKPENLLLDANMNIKIADFGMASMMKDGALLETSCGSPHYASPEIVMGTKYNGMEADVWSCGVVLYALLTGKLPFDDENMQRLLGKVRSGIFTMPAHLCPDAKDLIWKMLTVDPTKRISVEGIKKHAWYQKFLTEKEIEEESEAERETPSMEPVRDFDGADPEIIRTLKTLGWGSDEQLRESLCSEEPNLEKVFYRLLEKRKMERLAGDAYAPRPVPAGPSTPPMSAPDLQQQGASPEPLSLAPQAQPPVPSRIPPTATPAAPLPPAPSTTSAAPAPSHPQANLPPVPSAPAVPAKPPPPPPPPKPPLPPLPPRPEAHANGETDGHAHGPDSGRGGGHSDSPRPDDLSPRTGAPQIVIGRERLDSQDDGGDRNRGSLDKDADRRAATKQGKGSWFQRSTRNIFGRHKKEEQQEEEEDPQIPSSPKLTKSWFHNLFGISGHGHGTHGEKSGVHSTHDVTETLQEVHRALAQLSIPWKTLSDSPPVLRVDLPDEAPGPAGAPAAPSAAPSGVRIQIDLRPMEEVAGSAAAAAGGVMINFQRVAGDAAKYRNHIEAIQRELAL
eukprot:tig00000073_g1715.t2